jgi:hypothetical protein
LLARGVDGSMTIRPPAGMEQRVATADIRWMDRATRVEVRGSPTGTIAGALVGSVAFPVGTVIGGLIGYRVSTRLTDGWERLPVGDFPGATGQLVRYRLNGERGGRRDTVVARDGDTTFRIASGAAIDIRRLAWLEHRDSKNERIRLALPTSGFAVGQFVRARARSKPTATGYVIASPNPGQLLIETKPGVTVQMMRGELTWLERRVRRESSAQRGALVGIAAGTAVGFLAMADEKGNGFELGPLNFVIFVPVGAMLGSIVGVFIPHLEWEEMILPSRR